MLAHRKALAPGGVYLLGAAPAAAQAGYAEIDTAIGRLLADTGPS